MTTERTYELGEREGVPFIKCLRCNMVSYNPHDVVARYCGGCHQWHEGSLRAAAISVHEVIGEIDNPRLKAQYQCDAEGMLAAATEWRKQHPDTKPRFRHSSFFTAPLTRPLIDRLAADDTSRDLLRVMHEGARLRGTQLMAATCIEMVFDIQNPFGAGL